MILAMYRLAGILFLLLPLLASAVTHRVGKAYPGTSIKQALAQSHDGDTILVSAGTYREKNIVIDRSVVLKGENGPVLDGEKKYEIISIRAPRVTVEGFRIEHSGNGTLEDPAAVKIYNVSYVTIADNILDDNFFGIYVQYGAHCVIRNNRIKAYAVAEQQIGNGIHSWKCDSLQIIGNTIEGHRDGIYFEFVTNSVIWRNVSQGNIRYGLHFMFSNSDAYIANVFRNNGAGVAVMFTRDVKMYANYFEENWGDAAYGLLLKEISDSHIEGNVFVRNTSGIFVDGASRIQMRRNRFQANGWAMRIQASCMDITVSDNNFLGNTFDVGTNGSLVLNTFNGNYWDKYDGYDIDRDNLGDVPYRPVSMFSMIIERLPAAMMLFRSFITTLLDRSEKVLPGITPENLKDDTPLMKPLNL